MKRIAFALALASFFLAPAAIAGDLPPGGMTVQEVAGWLLTQGYPAQIVDDPTSPGDQMVSSSIDGINFDIYMYGCTGGRCDSLEYGAGWNSMSSLSTDKINAWTRDKRYVRAYLDNGTLWASYDLDISPGCNYDCLAHSLVRWRSVLSSFKTYFNL